MLFSKKQKVKEEQNRQCTQCGKKEERTPILDDTTPIICTICSSNNVLDSEKNIRDSLDNEQVELFDAYIAAKQYDKRLWDNVLF